jgi:putative glycosyltransferase (TIGR04372 family)
MRSIISVIAQSILVRTLLIFEILRSKSKKDFILVRDSINYVNQEYASLRLKLFSEHTKKRILTEKYSHQTIKFRRITKLSVETKNEMRRYDAFCRGDFEKFIKYNEEQMKLKRAQFFDSAMYKSGLILLSSDFFGAFGHLALGIDYLKMLRQLDYFSDIKFLRIKNNSKNEALLKYYDDYTSVIPIRNRYEEMLVQKSFNFSVLDVDYLHLPHKSYIGSQVYNFLAKEVITRKLEISRIELRQEEQNQLELFRKSVGMLSTDWFVVLHVREDSNSAFSASNAAIDDYKKAAMAIVQNGGWVVRIGESGVKNISWGDRVIDYANSKFKNSSMDIALLASCKFMVGTSSGPCSVPPIFGVPILYTNAPALAFSYRHRGLFIPQSLFHKELNRVLSPKESVLESAAWTTHVSQHANAIRIPNNPDQLEEGVMEMLQQDWSCEQKLTQEQSEFMTNVDVAGGYAGAIPALSYLRSVSQTA